MVKEERISESQLVGMLVGASSGIALGLASGYITNEYWTPLVSAPIFVKYNVEMFGSFAVGVIGLGIGKKYISNFLDNK